MYSPPRRPLSKYVIDLNNFGRPRRRLRQRQPAQHDQLNATRSYVLDRGNNTIVAQKPMKVSSKSSKIMFLLKRNQSKENSSDRGGSSARSETSTTSLESQNDNEHNNKKNSILKTRWQNPTIIRPAAGARELQPSIKKKAPPRPPPPRTQKGHGCIPVIPLDPPSYDEVLKADAAATFRTKGKAPQIPSKINGAATAASLSPFNRPDSSLTVNRGQNSSLLLDLNTPRREHRQLTSTSTNTTVSANLLDLEDVFGSISFSSNSIATANSVSNLAAPLIPAFSAPIENRNSFGPRQLEQTGSLLLDDVYQYTDTIEQPSASRRLSGLGPKVLPTDVPVTWRNKSEDRQAERPTPMPRSSLKSKVNKEVQSYVESDPFGDWGDEPTSSSSSSLTVSPSVPPRPLSDDGDGFVDDREADFLTTPSLPPLPSNYVRSEPHGVALYDFTSSQNDELSFKAGDTITLVHRINEEWFYGCLGEHEGMFPRSFLDVVVPLPDDTEFSSDTQAIAGPRCLSMFDFVGDNDEELSFRVGEIIRLVSRVSEHWLKGWLDGKVGLIPANFVRIIEDLPDDNGDSLAEARVLHTFKAESSSELSCEAGDVIKIVYPIDNDWVFAKNNEKLGLVPWTYLDLGQ